MNIDPHRIRCLVPELHDSKLRKVAFCVDVEIASGPRYNDDMDAEDKKKAKKDKKIKEKGEGDALKNPQAAAEEKDRDGVAANGLEAVGDENEPNPEGTIVGEEKPEISRKKEKKKRSEAERKERKERKRKKAEENGTIPLEFTRGEDDGSGDGAHVGSGVTTPRATDRPTIDPLRIYRRCCQLRESPILKRISDQLSAPQACAALQPGVVLRLDLTGSRLQMADILTLSDWLAIVPVKKLFLEDADLNDEKVRVILAGLLAAKLPEAIRHHASTQENAQAEDLLHAQTAIKKLVLKNNPKITAEGWKHIALFTYMCKSICALDVSMVPFPNYKPPPSSEPTAAVESLTPQSSNETKASRETKTKDVAEIFSKAISERLGGSVLQELVLGECALSSSSIRKIVDGCIISGVQRLGLATNDLDNEGLEHALQYIRSGVCQCIDLGGNDLREWVSTLCDTLNEAEHCTMWGLCLQNTGLTPDLLKLLFPALVSLPVLRFLDLSHNKGLLSEPTSLILLRKYMPQFKEFKRIHLIDVDMKPEDAIAIAEVLPDCPHIAHISIGENPLISHVATSTDEETQEDAAALYASLTLAAKLTPSLVCVDVDVPAPEMNEVVKALAKQIVAYCLRNIESINEVPELQAAPKQVEIPPILMHFVGNEDGDSLEDKHDPPTPDQDYIVGGTGLAKALNYCLSHRESDLRRMSLPVGVSKTAINTAQVPEHPAKARAMSKDLLENARCTRAKIQPALAREAKTGNEAAYRKLSLLNSNCDAMANNYTGRLLFLDQTLEGMIRRFETEFPDTRLHRSNTASTQSSVQSNSPPASSVPTLNSSVTDTNNGESDEDEPFKVRSRHNSDVSLANRHMAQEEGRLHRFGHRVRTGLLNSADTNPTGQDGKQTINSAPIDESKLPEHLISLRDHFFKYSGPEMKQMIEGLGWEKAFDSVVENAEELQTLERDDPEGFKIFRESQIAALKNRNPEILGPNEHEVARAGGSDCAIED